MNTLEEFKKKLDNLLDFVNENSDELIDKYELGLYLNCSHIEGTDSRNTESVIGKPFDIFFSIYSFLEKRPDFIEFLEKTIEITKREIKR